MVGDDGERNTAERFRELAGVPAANLAGQTVLPVLGAIIQRLMVLLTNDTGPAHLAYALQAPVVTVFGGADPARYGPLEPGPFRILVHPIACRPCTVEECPIGYQCLEQVSVEAVVEAAVELIDR